ncbi:hypothetical protein DFH08DRAFT_978095 [Mycena albidolilacea]|uniref:Uncharacterized protein n=1 Tax=Mycena albidolilacea TaxID=1033008 RepID=A0AAD6YZB7_9AGAR|nr:hypothetical protein DFH08DRAFT_978095 [Mycena albidolilacea]
MSPRVLHSSRPTSLARPPPTRPLPRAPVLLNMHALPAGFTTTLDFATFAADYATYAPLLRTPTSSMAYSLTMMRIDAEENSGVGEGALYAEANKLSSLVVFAASVSPCLSYIQYMQALAVDEDSWHPRGYGPASA